MISKWPTFMSGMRASSPLLVGVIPFGVICGAVCVASGMPEWGASVMSLIVMAGASQLAAVQLMVHDASLVVVIATALIINARMLMYSASIAPHFNGVSPWRKLMLSYLLTDQAYAISITRFNEPDAKDMHKVWYYLGAAIMPSLSFNVSTLAGAYLGTLIPPEWNLDFAIPLTFASLVIPAVKDKPTLLAAVVSGVVSFIADPMPYNLGLLTAAVSGIMVGYVAERRLSNA